MEPNSPDLEKDVTISRYKLGGEAHRTSTLKKIVESSNEALGMPRTNSFTFNGNPT